MVFGRGVVAVATALLLVVAAATGTAAQCCNTQPTNVCPPQYTFAADRPVVCSSFGDVHVHTFDGVAYEAQTFGEFYLTRPYNVSDASKSPLTVQARMAACDNSALNVEPSAAATGNAGVCNKGFAMTDGLKVLEFVHDRNADDLVVKIDGVRYPYITSLVQLGFVITVTSRENTGFNVGVVYTRGDVVNMKFFASGTASISIYQRPAVWGTVGGLCGFHDGCAGNDFFVRPDSPYAPNDSTPPSPITVSTVTSPDDTITPLPVLAGSLAPGLLFVNRSAAPADRDNHFVSSWRVPRRESLFTYEHGENYNLRFWKGLYITPSSNQISAAHQAGCRFLGYNMPSFLLSACESDYVRHTALTGSPSAVVGEVQREMLFDYCSYFCATSLFPFAHVDLHIGHCNGVCQYADGNTDLHGAYGAANLPPVVFSNENTNKAKITSTLNLAGKYTVRLRATDRCDTREGNVTLNIACAGGFTPDAVSVSPIKHTVERGWYGFPTVYFHGHAPAAAHRVSWKMMHWPGQDDLVAPVPRPVVSYSLSRHAAFQPVKAGNYTLQFAVYDGCHIFTSNVTIIAACSACQGSANMALYPLKYLIWGMYFTSAESGPLLAPQPSGYQQLQLVANDPFRLGYQWTHDWSISDDNNPLSNFTQVNKTHPDPKHKQYIVNHYFDLDVANLSREFPDGRVISFQALPMEVTLNVSTTTTYGPPVKDVGHVGPVGTQFGVFPPQLMFNRTRDATRTSVVRTILIETRNVTVTVFADSFPWCQIDLLNSDVTTATLTATPLITSTLDERFVRGQGCVGEYNLNLAVGEPECVTTRDAQSVEVTCGPPPQCFVSCPESLTFDYRNKVFPPVTIKGSASSDPYGRGPLRYLWYYTQKPEASARVNTDLCSASDQWGCTNADSTWVPDIDGRYEVLLSVSNGCNNASAYAQVLVECPYPWISPKFDMDETIDFKGVPPIVARLDATDSETSAKPVGGSLSYTWSVKRSPDSRPLPIEALPFIPSPVLSGGGASPLGTLTVFATGKYEVTLTATHGCNQSASVTQSTLTTCAASLFPVPGPDQDVLYSNTSFSWPTVALNGTGSYATSSSYTPTLAYLWVIDGTIVGRAAEIDFTPIKTGPNVVTLIINDGCNWAAKSLTVRASCRQLISNPQIVPGSPVDSGTALELKGVYSTGIIQRFNWTLEFAPAANEAQITNPNQATAYFTPQLAGKYGVRLCISDGCHQDCKTINLEVNCVNPLVVDPVIGLSSWSFNPSKMSKHVDVYWRENRFVQVAMSADGSTIGARNHTNPEFHYTWTVKRAPQQSLFEAIQTETSIPTFNWTAVINTTDHNVTVTNTTSWMTTVTTTLSNVKLTDSALINPHAWWPACFYPDLAGEYEIELRVVDYCLTKADSVFVTAHCSDAPVALVDVLPAAGWVGAPYLQTSGRGDSRTQPMVDVKLTLDRNSWRRVRLNGQPSMAFNNSQLSYYWAWNDTERANTKHAQDGIELPYSAQASILVPRAGTYRLAFYVHDGCAWSSVGVTITATCADSTALSFVDGTDRTYTYTVPTEDAVAVTTFPLAEKTTCASSNDVWSLIDFKAVVVPVPASDEKTDAGVVAGAVVGGLAAVVIVAGVIACCVKKRRAQQGSPRGSQLLGEDIPNNSQDIYAPPPVALGSRGPAAAAPAAPGGAEVAVAAAADNIAL